MVTSKIEVKIRPLVLEDLDVILTIDHKIRSIEKAITYEYLTTEHIFTIDRKVSRMKQPTNYVDMITGNIADLLDLGIVAEIESHVRGFILGKVSATGTKPAGEILILGVHPDFWRKGIASKLVNAIFERYRSKGIKMVKMEVDRRDKPLLDFCEHMGFNAGHRIDYSKTL